MINNFTQTIKARDAWMGNGISTVWAPNSLRLNIPTTGLTGSITSFGAEQKSNIIVTRVKIMITFCVVQNVIQIYNLVKKFNVLTDF